MPRLDESAAGVYIIAMRDKRNGAAAGATSQGGTVYRTVASAIQAGDGPLVRGCRRARGTERADGAAA